MPDAGLLAVPSKGTQIFYGSTSSPPIYTLISRQGSITGPGMTVKTQDVTAQDSGSPWRQYVPTLLDGGNITFKMFFIPGDVGQNAFLALFTGRGLNNTPGLPIPFKLLFADPDGTIWTFNGFVTTFKITATVDGVTEADSTIIVTGAPTFPVAAG
jgi:hypothetical protein